jgi:hypothetical protein
LGAPGLGHSHYHPLALPPSPFPYPAPHAPCPSPQASTPNPQPPTLQATRAFMSSISRYAGVALQNETFTRSVFNYIVVPGKAWTIAELVAAAPIQLKTL